MVKSVGLYRSGRGRSPVGKIIAWNLWRAQARFRRQSCSHHAAERTRCGVGVLRQLRHDRVADVKRHGVGQHRYAVAVDRRQQLRDGVGERALPVDPSLAPFLRTSQAVSRPFVPRFFLVFCAFSPSRRGGSNEPQAETQGQERAGTRTKTQELGPSFDTPAAVGRITWGSAATVTGEPSGGGSAASSRGRSSGQYRS